MKKWCILAVALGMAMPTFALDKNDVGEYVLLNKQGQTTSIQMKFFLRGSQWMMDGKRGDEAWKPVCHATGDCRLVASSAAKVAEYKTYLPQSLQQNPLSCVENKAFAFCHMSDKANPMLRAYWWLPLVAAKGDAIPVNRLR
ncbi:hypothetical protein [Wielerella bovis]|uniref:hypothetical protein n=1 Tax=Wielerella bovis TaxID=2917790 RepID=UPI0020199587|nr:hypothetical protein [Wielerella bovis]ULJ60729.1 hypothetical protein MIS44_02345 [Wielerella bovis]